MPLGPVFDAELVTTARRGRYYALRFSYGLILLAFVSARYVQFVRNGTGHSGGQTAANMAQFGFSLFGVLNAVQTAAVLFLTPALVAGTIAEERQRKTLHYLLASDLTGSEIVTGKLAARLLHSMVFLAVGLPVLGLLILFGGIDPGLIALAFAGSTSTAFLVAGMSIFASSVSRRAREAIALAYLLEVTWLAGPWVADALLSGWPAAASWVGAVLDWVEDSGPMALGRLGDPTALDALPRMAWMVGLQLVYGSIFVVLAVWRLRPSDRAVASGGAVGRRLIPRPIGDDPMLWKECRVARSSGPFRMAWTAVGLMSLASLAYITAMTAWSAFEEVASIGYGKGQGSSVANRDNLRVLVTIATAVVGFLWTVTVASIAAGGVTTEKEEDSWISLIATMLEGREILRAKRLGALLRPRVMLGALLVLWVVGVAAGSLHPVTLILLPAAAASVGAFASALGTYFSLRSRTTTRALAATLGILLALDIGGPICSGIAEPVSELLFGLCSPYVMYRACLNYVEVREIASMGLVVADPLKSEFVLDAAACLAGVVFHGLAAWLLIRLADRRFDRAVDRPRRPS